MVEENKKSTNKKMYLVTDIICFFLALANIFSYKRQKKHNFIDSFFVSMSISFIFIRLSILMLPLTENQKLIRKLKALE